MAPEENIFTPYRESFHCRGLAIPGGSLFTARLSFCLAVPLPHRSAKRRVSLGGGDDIELMDWACGRVVPFSTHAFGGVPCLYRRYYYDTRRLTWK